MAGLIKDADIVEVENHGRYCTLWLDDYPPGLRLIDKCLIGEHVFEQISVHYNFGNAQKQIESRYIGIVLDEDLPADWFIGKQVEVA